MGMLACLFKTCAILPGKSRPLFWEALDTSMAPNDMRMLAEILLDLTKIGQQIFIESHNYILIKLLELLSTDTTKICLYSIYRENKDLYICKEYEYTKHKNNKIDNKFDNSIDYTVIKYDILS